MKEVSSSVFRITYASLDTPVLVTSSGNPLGTWIPYGTEANFELAQGSATTQMDAPLATSPTVRPEAETRPTRSQTAHAGATSEKIPNRPSPWEAKYGKPKG